MLEALFHDRMTECPYPKGISAFELPAEANIIIIISSSSSSSVGCLRRPRAGRPCR